MYYSDNKIKYQYGLYVQNGKACPYINELPTGTNMQDIYLRIEEIEKKHCHYRQMFYIDNDFYDNKFTLEGGGTYYKFLRRPVAEWEVVSLCDKQNNYDDNVIYHVF